jgi:hypothetical protein
MQVCNTMEIQQMFTSFNNAQGKADTERVIRTVKDECIWLQEWNFRFTLIRALESRIIQYNEHYLHPALVYKPSRQFEREYHLNHGTQFTDARQIGSTILFALWAIHVNHAEHRTARDLVAELLPLAQHLDNPTTLRVAHHAVGSTWYGSGNYHRRGTLWSTP